MQAQNEIQPELFALLDRLAAIGRKVREKEARIDNDNHASLRQDDQTANIKPEMKND